ncbi:MAG: hypothetical protein KAI47_19570 [Deltaproteobacteria bacterium]|nr:hypothetical protein [Deltaproteobacteria bacterium]
MIRNHKVGLLPHFVVITACGFVIGAGCGSDAQNPSGDGALADIAVHDGATQDDATNDLPSGDIASGLPLTKVSVTSIPTGDATGAAHVGTYALETVIRACAGKCSVTKNSTTTDYCTVGYRSTVNVAVTQTDGALSVSFGPYVMEGGINKDETFDVGSYSEQGTVSNISRMVGTMTAAGKVTAVTETKLADSADPQGLNCFAVYDVTGDKQ